MPKIGIIHLMKSMQIALEDARRGGVSMIGFDSLMANFEDRPDAETWLRKRGFRLSDSVTCGLVYIVNDAGNRSLSERCLDAVLADINELPEGDVYAFSDEYLALWCGLPDEMSVAAFALNHGLIWRDAGGLVGHPKYYEFSKRKPVAPDTPTAELPTLSTLAAELSKSLPEPADLSKLFCPQGFLEGHSFRSTPFYIGFDPASGDSLVQYENVEQLTHIRGDIHFTFTPRQGAVVTPAPQADRTRPPKAPNKRELARRARVARAREQRARTRYPRAEHACAAITDAISAVAAPAGVRAYVSKAEE